MNPAPTRAQTSEGASDFAIGAGKRVDGSTAASGNRPTPIASRRAGSRFRGSDQPIRKGRHYKFHDASENHPSIPKSKQKDFTQETDSIPSRKGNPPSLIRAENGL